MFQRAVVTLRVSFGNGIIDSISCGSIGFNAGKLTRKDGRMKVKLKTLPNKPRSAAWPASVRAVRCQVKSCNERDPRPQLQTRKKFLVHSVETACVK